MERPLQIFPHISTSLTTFLTTLLSHLLLHFEPLTTLIIDFLVHHHHALVLILTYPLHLLPLHTTLRPEEEHRFLHAQRMWLEGRQWIECGVVDMLEDLVLVRNIVVNQLRAEAVGREAEREGMRGQ
ncbi:Hypothetical protein D9617_6g093490 [Elsinoe fawcettii]|nr:Hypothetical protein D9617_6g093490 [Elsinoe fawcettii]